LTTFFHDVANSEDMSDSPSALQEIDPEELASLPEFYHPAVSPSGGDVAFYYDETGRNELYTLDLDTGEYEQWSDGEVPRSARWPHAWGGSDDRIYFHVDEGGNEQNDLHALTREGDHEVVVEVDGQAILYDVSQGGGWLLYGSDEGDQMNCYRYDRESGETEQLTEYEQPFHGGLFGPEDDRVAYVANESETLHNRDAYVMQSDGSEKRRLDVGEDGSEAGVHAWFPDGDRLLIDDNADDLSKVGIYDLDADEIEWLSDGRSEETAEAVSPDGRHAIATRQREGATMPVVYDVETGDSRELSVDEGVAALPHVPEATFVDETTLIFGHTTSGRRKELYRYDLEEDEFDVLLEAEYGDVDPDAFVSAEYVTYESIDGRKIGALLYDSGERPSAAVVMVHGGPHGRSSKAFDLYAQFLVSKGYSVLQPNYRGSTGRGREFKQAILGDWGGSEQADVARGGMWLREREWIDGDRIAVFGGSYGGYSAYMQLVTYPSLWTTGVAWIGMTDLPALYEASMPHFQSMLEQQLGDPEENADRWANRSAITHVENLEAPVFVIHGVNDPRVPISQARRFKEALEERRCWTEGEDFEYEELSEEGHGSTDVSQKIRAFELLGDYLDRRL
jgi:dipeptidyl aminopeptidase/acylaminoacyl peptidase